MLNNGTQISMYLQDARRTVEGYFSKDASLGQVLEHPIFGPVMADYRLTDPSAGTLLLKLNAVIKQEELTAFQEMSTKERESCAGVKSSDQADVLAEMTATATAAVISLRRLAIRG